MPKNLHEGLLITDSDTCYPFQAEACRSVAMAMKKCPHGMFAEIKYDGERVQVHKQGDTFQYFSRSLKPVQAHKVKFLLSTKRYSCVSISP